MFIDGLSQIFSIIKVTPDINQLPSNYRAVTEWGRITCVYVLFRDEITDGLGSLASTIFQMFVASDTASETFASLKRLHGLMPYFLLRTALKISSPVAMMRSKVHTLLRVQILTRDRCGGYLSCDSLWWEKSPPTVVQMSTG